MDTHINPVTGADHKIDLSFPVAAETLFAALSTLEGAQSWWTTHCEVGNAVGELSTFRFEAPNFLHTHVMKIVALDAPRRLEWESVGSSHKSNGKLVHTNEWLGTHIIFEVSEEAGGTGASRLRFTHTNLNTLPCKEECHQGWDYFLRNSLRNLLEKGEGKPWRDTVPF